MDLLKRMHDLFTFLFLCIAGVFVYYSRKYLVTTINYRESRAHEIKRRLQVEHKQEQALKTALSQPLEDNERFKLEIRAAHERHQRQVHYVIEDMFERYQ